jgi:hypothetical protein
MMFGGSASAEHGELVEVLEPLNTMVEITAGCYAKNRYVVYSFLKHDRVLTVPLPPTVVRVKVVSGECPHRPSLYNVSQLVLTSSDGSGTGLLDLGQAPDTLVTPSTTTRRVGWNTTGELHSSYKLCTVQGNSLGYMHRCWTDHLMGSTKSPFLPATAILVVRETHRSGGRNIWLRYWALHWAHRNQCCLQGISLEYKPRCCSVHSVYTFESLSLDMNALVVSSETYGRGSVAYRHSCWVCHWTSYQWKGFVHHTAHEPTYHKRCKATCGGKAILLENKDTVWLVRTTGEEHSTLALCASLTSSYSMRTLPILPFVHDTGSIQPCQPHLVTKWTDRGGIRYGVSHSMCFTCQVKLKVLVSVSWPLVHKSSTYHACLQVCITQLSRLSFYVREARHYTIEEKGLNKFNCSQGELLLCCIIYCRTWEVGLALTSWIPSYKHPKLHPLWDNSWNFTPIYSI